MADATEATEVETTEVEATTTQVTTEPDETEKWKSLSRKNENELKKARAELDKLREQSMSEVEKAVAQARAEGRAEASKEANKRLLHAEVRAAAASVLADPDDAVHLLDLDSFDVDGEIDRRAIKSALSDLVKSKPYLSAQPGNGSGEGGARGADAVALNGDPLLRDLERVVGAPRR